MRRTNALKILLLTWFCVLLRTPGLAFSPWLKIKLLTEDEMQDYQILADFTFWPARTSPVELIALFLNTEFGMEPTPPQIMYPFLFSLPTVLNI